MDKALLKERARALANRKSSEPCETSQNTFLVFLLGSERYALPLRELIGLTKLEKLTPVPDGHPSLLGLVNVRGEVRPVYDLAGLLDLHSHRSDSVQFALMVPCGELKVGLGVDKTLGTLKLEDVELSNGSGYIDGKTEDGLAVLNLQQIWKTSLFRESTQA